MYRACLAIAIVAGLATVVHAASAGGRPGPLDAERTAAQPPGNIGNDAPAWSPNGRRIAFTSFRHGRGEIYVMNPNGTNQRRLTRHRAHDDLPAWSPDGRKIAFTSARSGGRDIYVMNADGSAQTRLTDDPHFDFWPAWSHDGRKIAFRSNRNVNGDIYVMNADGTDETNVTRTAFHEESPRWSPDGRILFASNRSRVGQITQVYSLFVMNADGTGVRKLTANPTTYEDERAPDWSRDGRRVTFISDRNLPFGNLDIYVVNADGTGERRLTTYRGHDDWPAWSPNGRQIAFSRGPAFWIQDIHVMNADGTGVKRLTRTTASRSSKRRR